MGLPVVAIIGRPNVGKSSLLNALAGQQISIVEPTAGVTRDRVSTLIGRDDRYFELIDTGGYGLVDSEALKEHIERQILLAIGSASLVLFMVDIRDGVTPLDEQIAQLLRKHNLPVIGVANKADTARMFPQAGEFTRLGFGEFLCISAQNNLNKAVLLDMIFERLKDVMEKGAPPEPVMKIAIVGTRNAGTTRDSVDVRIEKDGQTLVVIDTAGIRKKGKMSDDIEYYGYVRAIKSIHRADVVWFLVDATEPVSAVDKHLARHIADECKTCILVVNKWDLAKDAAATGDYEDYLTKTLPVLKYAPIAFTTATAGKNVQSVLDLSAELFKQSSTHISTPQLNKAMETIRSERTGARRNVTIWPKVYYATQIASNPVTILMFVNNPKLFETNYMRYVSTRLQALLPISEVPIRLLARPRREAKKLNARKKSRPEAKTDDSGRVHRRKNRR